jgi:hypothetical protein
MDLQGDKHSSPGGSVSYLLILVSELKREALLFRNVLFLFIILSGNRSHAALFIHMCDHCFLTALLILSNNMSAPNWKPSFEASWCVAGTGRILREMMGERKRENPAK